mgnify:CR=1 FL=1
MTQLLIRLFIRHPDNPQDPHTGPPMAIWPASWAWCAMFCSAWASSPWARCSVPSPSCRCPEQPVGCIVQYLSLVGFKLASRAPDAEHPFGHARYEYLAGLVVSVTGVLGLIWRFPLLKESVVKVLHPTAVQFSLLTVACWSLPFWSSCG